MPTGSGFNSQHEISDRVRSKFLIDGEWKAPSGSAKLDLISPDTEGTLSTRTIEELKAHTDELCTFLTAENGRPFSMAQFEITWILENHAPALLQMELRDSTSK